MTPCSKPRGLFSERIPLTLTAEPDHIAQVDPEVQQSILTLEKYRKTQLAETKLQAGDTAGAATFLQSAAKTALQMGDTEAAKVLEASAQELQQQSTLSEAALKRTRIASKTVLSNPPQTSHRASPFWQPKSDWALPLLTASSINP